MMASVKAHYDKLLAEHYTWMCGDYDTKVRENTVLFQRAGLTPRSSGRALDLGCGSGFQCVALAKLGFKVLGIDLCASLLEELRGRSQGLDVDGVQGDILDHEIYSGRGPFEVAVSMGDTLTHLPTVDDVMTLLENVYRNLEPGGTLVLAFRDLTKELQGTERIVPVRTDEDKLMAAFLEYEETHVRVHDMIFLRGDSGWVLKKSAYQKLRLGAGQVRASLEQIGFVPAPPQLQEGFSIIVAQK